MQTQILKRPDQHDLDIEASIAAGRQRAERIAMRVRVEMLRDAAENILKAMEWLESHELQAIGSSMGLCKRPIIHIATSGQCTWLQRQEFAYPYMRTRSQIGMVQVWRATVCECTIEWIEKGI